MISNPTQHLSPRTVYKGQHSTLGLQLNLRTLLDSKHITLNWPRDMKAASIAVLLPERRELDDLPEYTPRGAAPWQLQHFPGAPLFFMAQAGGEPILHNIRSIIKERLQQRHIADLARGNYTTTPYLQECGLTPWQWKTAIMAGPRCYQREQIQYLTSSNPCRYLKMKHIPKSHPHAKAIYQARHTCLQCQQTCNVYPAHHVLFCTAQSPRDLRHRLYTTIVGIFLNDKVVQGKRPPMMSLIRKLWINMDVAPTFTPLHRQAMLLAVAPSVIRLNCGFPAASDRALELVSQAIQEYRREVTADDIAAYHEMMRQLTRFGPAGPDDTLDMDTTDSSQQPPVTTRMDTTPASKRKHEQMAATSDDEAAVSHRIVSNPESANNSDTDA